MLTLEIVNKITKRIKKSKKFDENWIANMVYSFDDSLKIERYNNLFKIEFKGQTMGHLHNKAADKEMHDILYYAIEDKKDELKKEALNEL